MKSTRKRVRRKNADGNNVAEVRARRIRSQLIGAAIIASSSIIAMAASVPNTFTSGSPALASDVNANFQSLAAAVTAMEAKLASMSLVTVNGQPTVRFSGVNVQIVNGVGNTATVNGKGNLLIGYDETDISGSFKCSLGTNPTTLAIVTNQTECISAGGSWATSHKSGSHYLVMGSQNNYSRWGGVVSGVRNTSNYNYASLLGGYTNAAGGEYAVVTGGSENTASGARASVSGGQNNIARGGWASVSAGRNNVADGGWAGISGGSDNVTQSGPANSVSGGWGNIAMGQFASVTGGSQNIGSGVYASVNGGYFNKASGGNASVAGGYMNISSGGHTSVSGGSSCEVWSPRGWDVGSNSAGCSPNVSQ